MRKLSVELGAVLSAMKGLNIVNEKIFWPVKLDFKLARLRKALSPMMDSFEESRRHLFDKLSEGGEEIPVEKQEQFDQEFSLLLRQQVELEVPEISITEFPEDVQVPAGFFAGLGELIQD